MFKFGFSTGETNTEDCTVLSAQTENIKWLASKEIFISDANLVEKNESNDIDIMTIGSEKLLYVKPSRILLAIKDEKCLSDENISLAEQSHSDLITSKYEGGLKIWECTNDIASYIELSHICGKSVLDLGCGVGLLGILALKLGAEEVHFQDYNVDVLRFATIPNVMLNANPQKTTCRFFSGDWESFGQLTQFSCDILLTSETIYNPDNYLKLHNVIQKFLKPTGIALLAAKSYYFGVGGSTRQFEKIVLERNVFNIEVAWKCSQGVQREILKLTFKNIEM